MKKYALTIQENELHGQSPGLAKPAARAQALLLLIFLVALGVRLWYAWPTLAKPRPFQGDEASYYELAISVMEGHGLARDGIPSAYRPPGFPLFLAPVYAVFGTAPFAAVPVLVLLNALICLGVYWLGRELFNPTVGLLAAAINAGDVYIFIYGSVLLAETIFVLLLTLGLVALERLRRRQTWPWAVAVGFLWGAAMFTKANLLPFLPFLGGWIIYSGRDHLRRAGRNGLIVVGIIGLIWSGWVVRNYLSLGEFIPITTQGGPAYHGLYNDKAADYARLGTFGQWQNAILPLPPNLTEVETNRRYKEAGLAWIRASSPQGRRGEPHASGSFLAARRGLPQALCHPVLVCYAFLQYLWLPGRQAPRYPRPGGLGVVGRGADRGGLNNRRRSPLPHRPATGLCRSERRGPVGPPGPLAGQIPSDLKKLRAWRGRINYNLRNRACRLGAPSHEVTVCEKLSCPCFAVPAATAGWRWLRLAAARKRRLRRGN